MPLNALRILAISAACVTLAGQRAILQEPTLEARRAAIRALAESKSPEAVPELLRLTGDPAVRGEAMLALAQLADRRALPAFLDGLTDRDERIRGACARVVLQLGERIADDLAALEKRSELSPDVRRALGAVFASSPLLNDKDAKLAFLKNDVPKHLDLAIYRKHAQENRGDAQRGGGLFFDSHGIGCVRCHNVGDQTAAKMGPNLAGIGAKQSREEIIRSVLEPSSRIAPEFSLTVIATADGRVLQGRVQSETDAALKLVDESGNEVEVAKADIHQRVISLLSPMPNGLERGMALEDFADLVAFLESLKD